MIPILSRHGKHRADTDTSKLRDENRRLLTQVVGAGDAITLLEQQLADVRAKQAEAEMAAVALEVEVYDLAAERDHLAEELAALRHRFAPELAAAANTNAITVPRWVRDTSNPADQATGPLAVYTLRQALDRTSPAHIPPAV
ncbi:hypothetical protein ACIOEX_01215 [Streptomyces sp. NPDC087850]|uniref:hypothetical protein n=1 Tax=Streptomyces sp. NPDC087850 TaxID=3365809 RepID=UPI003800338B